LTDHQADLGIGLYVNWIASKSDFFKFHFQANCVIQTKQTLSLTLLTMIIITKGTSMGDTHKIESVSAAFFLVAWLIKGVKSS